MKRIIYIFSVSIFVLCISSCFSLLGDGSNTLVKESVNNVHTKKAILFLRQAGATVGDSYQVSVTDYKTPFDTLAVGNVFTVDNDHGKVNLNSKAINFKWISDNELEISYDKNLRTFIQQKNINDVNIVYKLK